MNIDPGLLDVTHAHRISLKGGKTVCWCCFWTGCSAEFFARRTILQGHSLEVHFVFAFHV